MAVTLKSMLACTTTAIILSIATAHAQQPPGNPFDPRQLREMQEEHGKWLASEALNPSSGAKIIATAGPSQSLRQVQLADGTTIWLNKSGQPHDVGSTPAVQYPGGGFEHFNNGRISTAPGSTLAARMGDVEIHLIGGAVTIKGAGIPSQ